MQTVLALVRLVSFDSQPILSWPGTSSFGQVFNPAWVGGPKPGLLLRTQNCTARVGDCVRCSGNGSAASVLTFSAQERSRKGGPPTYAPITGSSVVFGPHDATDDLGTEDPRVTYDASSGTHYMFYTCYNSGSTPQPRVTLCLATTADPSSAIGWARYRTLYAHHTACRQMLHGQCMGSAWTLHEHCMGTTWTLRVHCVHTACTGAPRPCRPPCRLQVGCAAAETLDGGRPRARAHAVLGRGHHPPEPQPQPKPLASGGALRHDSPTLTST